MSGGFRKVKHFFAASVCLRFGGRFKLRKSKQHTRFRLWSRKE